MRFASLRALPAAALALLFVACTSDLVVDPAIQGVDARFAVSADSGKIIINEIMADPSAVADASGEWFEVYNASSTPIDLQGWKIASANDAVHTIGTSVVVPAGGYAVLGRNANTATNGGVTLAYSYATAPTPNLANSTTDWLALRDASGASVDSVFWGSPQPPSGASRGLAAPGLDNTVMAGANWTTQTTVFGAGDRGTPGATNDGSVPPPPPPPPATGDVVINEVLADPSAVLDANGEWFEVHNRGTTAVDLAGWIIASNNDAAHTIGGSVVIAAGGFAVLGRNGNAATNGGVTVHYVYAAATTLNLGNGSDWLALRTPAGASADSVSWTSVPAGASRALIDPASDNVNLNGSAWMNSFSVFGAGDRGTPGSTNSVTPPVAGEPAVITIAVNFPQQIPVGYTKPAFPTVRDGFGTIVSPPPALTWSSTDASVATVDSLGYIHGQGTGVTTIRATAPNGVSGSVNITIIPGSAPTPAVYRDHVEFGTPTDGSPGDDFLVTKPQYVLSYNDARGGPNWVSWNLNATHFGSAPRCDCFSADQSLPASFYQVVDFDYRNSGYDRGHMVMSESRTSTDQENATTFLLTNILPQAGENNQGPWVRLEIHLNDLARQQGKEIYVVQGGEYSATPGTLKNEGKVAIPDYTWKVAVVMDGGEGLDDVGAVGDVEVIAVKMPNLTTPGGPASAVGIRNNPWEMYQTTVDAIEAAVGYDLLSALPNAIERIVESNDRPPVAATDGPYVAAEGATVHLSAAASTDPDGDVLEYAWDFGDGSTGTGVSPTHAYADNGNYQVSVTVTDPYGASSTATTTVTVMNVAPAVAAFGGATLLPHETYTAGGSFTDPGADSWTATVDYGDGSGAQPLALSGKTFSLSHAYAAPGTYTVTVTVADDDGDSHARTATVVVQTLQQGVANLAAMVEALVDAGVLNHGNGNALDAKLDAADKSLDKGHDATAANQLGAFVNQVEAFVSTGKLTAAQGQALIAEANRIIASIGG
ncbi:MAG TPA: DNA/RNA non-specific endonuclease [Longimicrobiaceae bacterium]|nr:DNA/RNA non-specific endonuclease [Longimicrobiaceae bacterium]